MAHAITVTVNGQKHQHEVEPRLLLVHYLREVLGLTGTHIGCDTSQCGACTVFYNSLAVKSCTMFAVQADGSEVLTVEGVASNGDLDPIQEGFWEEHLVQCVFGTPGCCTWSCRRLKCNPAPSETESRSAFFA